MTAQITARVQSSPLDLAAMTELPRRHGAQVVFLGVVRDHNHGRAVTSMSYDAFEPLAERILAEIAHEASAGVTDVLVVHRIGRLTVGEASVLVVTSAPHRAEAYQASRHVIEEIKKRVPIWKQETYADGESAWLSGHALCGHSDRNPAPTESHPT